VDVLNVFWRRRVGRPAPFAQERQGQAMKTASRDRTRAGSARRDGPHFLYHPSFAEADAGRAYGGEPAAGEESAGFLPDDATRDCTKRMHYAGWRAARAGSGREAARWRRRYYDCRDRIVLGNRKLAYRAVQKWSPPRQLADDMAAECQVVLIKAVVAYNPWLGIRFSTYAFTCLMRALSRLSQRQAADRLSRCLSLDALRGDFGPVTPEEPAASGHPRVDEFLRPGHTLLTPREKTVLIRRYCPEEGRAGTLEQVGHELGLSKERVRQLQTAALGKLRVALAAEAPPA
jgi:RNA polymerase sigma factor (sigma-70 family)